MALAPVSASERIPTLDVLRGLALYGVLTANLSGWYSGLSFLPPDQVRFSGPASFYLTTFVFSRAVSTLTILFGIGFATQLLRADDRGEDVRATFVRRLLVMATFGAAHVLLLWWGDILWTYALCGFALLVARRWSQRSLLIWGGVLMLVPMLIFSIPDLAAAIKAALPHAENQRAFNAEMITALRGDDRLTITAMHLEHLLYFLAPVVVWYWPWVTGHFLIGLAAGKARIFERDGADHRRLFRWLLAIGAVFLAVGIVISLVIHPSRETLKSLPLAAQLAFRLLHEMITLGTVAFYISAVVLLMRRSWARRILMIVAPVGRMPLTTYLMQSLISTSIFYGWGLGWIGYVSATQAIMISAAVFAVQVVLANLWLRRFRSGPLEWLWRRLTYRRPTSSGGDVSTMLP